MNEELKEALKQLKKSFSTINDHWSDADFPESDNAILETKCPFKLSFDERH